MKEYHFVYVTTNLINGKKYVGDHSTDNLEDGYLGSGRPTFNNAKKKYGKENFEKKILEFFDTKLEAFNAQEKYIKIEESHVSQNGYNISWKGGHGVKDCISEETKNKLSIATKNWHSTIGFSEETKKKLSKSLKGKNIGKIRSEEFKQRISEATSGENNGMYGKNHSKESKEKQRIAAKNRKTHGMKGKFHSEESRQKIKEKKKGTIPWNKGLKIKKLFEEL